MKKVLIVAGLVVAVAFAVGAVLYGKTFRFFSRTETVAFDPQLRIFLGGGGNSIVLTSEDGATALVVDTKMRGSARAMRAAVAADSVIVVNTHLHSDHTGGNRLYPGALLIAGAYPREQWAKEASKSRYPDRTLQPGEEDTLRIGSERVRIRNMGCGHTENDLVVYLENRKLLATGDLVFRNSHPFLMERDGCRVSSWIRVLEEADSLFDVRTLVPGHGSLLDRTALSAMRDYFVSAGEAVGHPEKAAMLRKKYDDLLAIPGVTGMSKTIDFIARERKAVERRP
jgi:glyoxylase-like metal-dependent hydrolase (beta-lactamase superfamily II)